MKSGAASRCLRPNAAASACGDAIAAAERELSAWLSAQAGVPGVEVHADSDATWVVHPGPVWSNCVTNVRFSHGSASARLDEILARYRTEKRGVGFWISQFATPAEIPHLLKARGLRCRKHFPVMFRDFNDPHAAVHSPEDIKFALLDDYAAFDRHPHPYFGRVSTPLGRFELARLICLNQKRPRRVWDFVAWRNGVPVSGCTMFRHGSVVGFHDVGTLPAFRRKGIASALMQEACSFAREHGCKSAVLLATGIGCGMYQRAGFRDVGSIAYWYRSFQSNGR